MKRIKLLLSVLLVACMSIWAAPNSLYFMDILPYQAYQNPALQPLCNTYVELPGISTVSASAGLGNLSLNDIMYVRDGKLVTFLHPEYGSKDALFAKLNAITRATVDADVTLLGFGFKVKERGYFSFNNSLRVDAMAGLPKDLMSLGLYGTPDTLGVNRYNLGSTRVNARAYMDISGGYSHRINDQWTVGGRLHFLIGVAAAEAHFDELYLEASQEVWNLRGKGMVNISMPGLRFTTDEQGGIAGLAMEKDVNAILSAYQPSLGAAIDLGVSYKPIPELTLSLSLKDIGFMYWNNLSAASGSIDGSFDGIYMDFNESPNLVDSLVASIGASYRVDDKTSYVQEMRGKLYVGAEYSFLRNMMSVGVLSKTEFMSNYVTEEISLNYKIRPCHWFGISAGYSFFSGGWSTLGFAMDLKLPPFNFYVATDYTPLYYSAQGIPYKSQAVNVQAGIVLTFKTKDNTKRLTARTQELAEMPVDSTKVLNDSLVLDSLSVTEPVEVPEIPMDSTAVTEPVEVPEIPMDSTAVTEPVEVPAIPADSVQSIQEQWEALVDEAGVDSTMSVTTVVESTMQEVIDAKVGEDLGTEVVKMTDGKKEE